MQPQRFSQRLSKAKDVSSSGKNQEEKKGNKQAVKKVSASNVPGRKPVKNSNRVNLKEPNNVDKDLLTVDEPVCGVKNKDGSIGMGIIESDTPKKNSRAFNLKTATNVGNCSDSQPSNIDTSIDMSVFESDTPSRSYGSQGFNVRSINKGRKTPSGTSFTDSERLSYLKLQQRDPRNANYSSSESKARGSMTNKASTMGKATFGYQEERDDTDFYLSRNKRNLDGLQSQKNKGIEFKSSSYRGDLQVPKNRFEVHRSSFEGASTGNKTQIKQGYGSQSSSFGNNSRVPKTKELKMTPIKDVNPMMNDMAIKGRCISIWHSHKLNEEHEPYSLDCIFQDVEGERIQIYIKKEFMFKFEPLLQEGHCYMISNFGVAENGGRLPLLPNRWKISFFKGTNVTRIEQIDDNFVGFINEPFTRILDPNNEYHEHDCVDVIGTVVAVGKVVSVNSAGGPKIRRTVVIEDAESNTLDCTFWDNWALMWNEYDNRLEEIGHLDFLLMLGKIKYWDNKPAVHNALFGSKIYINRNIPQLLAFREMYESQEGYDPSEFKIHVHTQDRHVVTPSEFMQGCVKKFVGMIRTIEPGTCCVVYATIHSIQYQNGWVYTGCRECNTRVNPISTKSGMNSKNKNQLWFCKRHGETYAVACRFKIIVRIVDATGTAQVVIFDNNVHKMTNVTAWEIMKENGVNTDEYFPDVLNEIVGKQYLFKIKYTEFNHTNNSHIYRTEKVTDDIDTVTYFKDGFIDEEDDEEDLENDGDYNDNSEDEFDNSENHFPNGGKEFQNSDAELENDGDEFHNGDKEEDSEDGEQVYANDEDDNVIEQDTSKKDENVNFEGSVNLNQNVVDDIEKETDFDDEANEAEIDLDVNNTRMNNSESTSNDVGNVTSKKRKEATIGDNDLQGSKKMSTVNITKDV